MASQLQSRLSSTSLSSLPSHSSFTYSSHSSFSPSLSYPEVKQKKGIKQEKGIGEEDWIIAEDGGPTSYQPPILETPQGDGLPGSSQSPLGEPSGRLRELLSKGGNNVSYLRITGCTNFWATPPLVSISSSGLRPSLNKDTHQDSSNYSCFVSENKGTKDRISVTPPTQPEENPSIHQYSEDCSCFRCGFERFPTPQPHQYAEDCSCIICAFKRYQKSPTELQANSSLNLVPDSPFTARPPKEHNLSVNCPCLSCEDRRKEMLGSPSTRQQPNPLLDLVPCDSISVIESPELLSPSLPSTSFSRNNTQDCEGSFYNDVRAYGENHARLASLESALPIQPQSPVRVAPAISAIRRNPSRQANEKALVRIRECLGKKSKF